MAVKKTFTLRLIAGITAIALIIVILFITNSFVGNPISASLATKDINTYIKKNYSNLDLEIGKASYNFKFGKYYTKVKSRTNIDVQFTIYWKNGKVLRDNYESYVLSGYNTLSRFSSEYSVLATDILKDKFRDSLERVNVMYSDKSFEKHKDLLKLGMNFDKSLPLDAEITLNMNLKDASLKSIAEILSTVHNKLRDNDCIFTKYGIYTESEGMMIMVNEVTPFDIESGKLEELLINAEENTNNSKILVFIKYDRK